MTITWTHEIRKIKDLIPYTKNPRILHKQDEASIKASIEKFGVADPIIINTDNTIIGGHQRIATLKKLKMKTVSAMVPNRLLTDAEVEELCIRLNRNHGTFDYEILGNMFNVADLLEWGFTSEELFDGLKTEDLCDTTGETETKEKETKTCPHCGEAL